MSVILDAIKESLRNIKFIFEPTETSFSKDTKKTGDAKEVTVKDFIQRFFPATFQIKKGLIYSLNDSSNEIDCVLLAPNHPRLETPIRDIILAEGVLAAIEVKPDISTLTEKSEFYRGLRQIQSVKKLQREIAFIPTGYIPPDHRIPCVIFSNRSRSLGDMTDYMIGLITKREFEPTDLPDIILTLDHGIIYHSAFARQCILNDFVSKQTKITSDNMFLEFPYNDSTLPFFIFLLQSITPPEPYLSDPILKRYLTIETPAVKMKNYESFHV